jgi:hypothetical protein
MRKLVFGEILALAAAALLIPAAASEPNSQRTWDVTITNLTPPGSQPLSAPLFVVHSKRAQIWSPGQIATHPVAAIAEDANNAPAESARSSQGSWTSSPGQAGRSRREPHGRTRCRRAAGSSGSAS